MSVRSGGESACDLPGLVMVAIRLRLARLCQSIGAIKLFHTVLASESTDQVKPRSPYSPPIIHYEPYTHYVSNRIIHNSQYLTTSGQLINDLMVGT